MHGPPPPPIRFPVRHLSCYLHCVIVCVFWLAYPRLHENRRAAGRGGSPGGGSGGPGGGVLGVDGDGRSTGVPSAREHRSWWSAHVRVTGDNDEDDDDDDDVAREKRRSRHKLRYQYLKNYGSGGGGDVEYGGALCAYHGGSSGDGVSVRNAGERGSGRLRGGVGVGGPGFDDWTSEQECRVCAEAAKRAGRRGSLVWTNPVGHDKAAGETKDIFVHEFFWFGVLTVH